MSLIKEIYKIYSRSTGVSIDTRSLEPNQLFFALSGPNFNGNDFAVEALRQGAIGAVVSDQELAQGDSRMFYSPNVLSCLQRLAFYHRQSLRLFVIGITGSNGKTTNKELLYHVLSRQFQTEATHGNLNNHIGVPLTLLSLDPETEIAIVEMGANHPGEIKTLCQIADPTHGLITNIGMAHLEGFGSLERIRQTKFALYHHVVNRDKGIFFLNRDEPTLSPLPQNHPGVISFGGDKLGCGYQLYVESDSPEIVLSVTSSQGGPKTPIGSPLYGSHNVENLRCAIAIGLQFGLTLDEVKIGIESYVPTSNRSQIIHFNEVSVFLDAYNANPTSVEKAVHYFNKFETTDKWLILGDMLELGEDTDQLHRLILQKVQELDFDRVLLVGPIYSALQADFHSTYINFYEVVEHLISDLKTVAWNKQSVYIKGSRAIGLEQLLSVFPKH